MDKISGKDIENHYFRKRAVRIFALVSGVICAVFFSLALVMEFETENGVYSKNAIFAPIAELLTIGCSVIAAVICAVFVPKEKETEHLFPDENRYDFYFRFDPLPVKAIRYIVAAAIFLESLAEFVIVFLSESYFISPWMEILRLLLAFSLALYFVPELTDMCREFCGKAHLYLGAAGCFWFLLTIIKIYFDMSLPIASRYRVTDLLCVILCLIGILFDLKLRTGANSIKRRLAFFSIGFIVSFAFNFGRLLMMLFGKMPSVFEIIKTVYCLIFAMYFGARLLFYTEE